MKATDFFHSFFLSFHESFVIKSWLWFVSNKHLDLTICANESRVWSWLHRSGYMNLVASIAKRSGCSPIFSSNVTKITQASIPQELIRGERWTFHTVTKSNCKSKFANIIHAREFVQHFCYTCYHRVNVFHWKFKRQRRTRAVTENGKYSWLNNHVLRCCTPIKEIISWKVTATTKYSIAIIFFIVHNSIYNMYAFIYI